jgi:hypothetical protein
MPYKKDPMYLSVFWGRIGTAVLLLIAFTLGAAGFVFSEALQSQAFDAINQILIGAGTLLVIVSKIRESKKIDQAEEDLEALNRLPAFKDEK